MKDKTRINYIDIVKGVGILCIVLGHVMGEAPARYGIDLKQTSFYMFLFSFHVPIFYIVSGILMRINKKNENVKEFILRKCKTYLWPYLTFSLIAIITRIAYKGAYHETDVIQFAIKTTIKTITLDGFLTLWFIPALLMGEILFIIIVKISFKKRLLISIFIIVLCSLISTLLNNPSLSLPRVILELVVLINRVFIAFSFISIGYYLATIKIKRKSYSLLCLIIIVINICFCKYNGSVELKRSLMGNNVVLFWYFALSTSFSIIIIAKTVVAKCKPIEYFGKNSLIIMATHFPIPMIEILRKNTWDIPLGLNIAIIFILVMIIELVLIYLINNYGRKVIQL